MKKFIKFLASLICVAVIAVPMALFTACGGSESESGGNSGVGEVIDYASELSLDFSSDTKKQEVTVRLYVDGDTTYFDPVQNSKITPYNSADFAKTQGYIKARYLAVNTPESTGDVEEWGKAASNFTRSKLEGAKSIVVESDNDKWNIDSTGERYTLWIWYVPKDGTEYRNLNLEILQEGLAFGSSTASNRYGKTASAALTQARALKLHVYSGEKDPDYYYGSSIQVTMKELRAHASEYISKRVRVEGVITADFNHSVYLEEYDAETDTYFGISVYYAFQTGAILNVLSVGNRVSVSGVLSLYDATGTYQLSAVEYNAFDPKADKNSIVISKDNSASFKVTEAKDIVSGKLTLQFEHEKENEDGEIEAEIENLELAYGEAIMSTTVTLENLTVTDVYTTHNGGDSDGAMSLTCRAADGTIITVRTEVLKDADGNIITQDKYEGKKITVKGLIERYNGKYQVKCHRADYITVFE